MTTSEDHTWREIERRLGPPGATGLERDALFDPYLIEHDADSMRIEAERLRKAFEHGDMLAPFECCSIWAEAGLDSALLPGWARDRLFEIAAKYFDAGPFKEDHPVTPRHFIKMPRAKRKSAQPSLDAVADLAGGRGTPGAWLQRAEFGRDEYVLAYLDGLMEKRDQLDRRGPSPLQFLQTEDGRRFPVFVEQGAHKGQFRGEALDHIASVFRVKGHNGENRARTMRRHFRLEPLKADK